MRNLNGCPRNLSVVSEVDSIRESLSIGGWVNYFCTPGPSLTEVSHPFFYQWGRLG